MAETKLVKDQAVEGAQLIEQLRRNHFDVTAACWLFDHDREDWKLYIVSQTISDKGWADAHAELQKAFEQLPDLWMDSSEVRLVDPADRVAQEIAAIQLRHPVRLKRRHHIKLGGLSSADVHIYPMPAQTSSVPGN
jgi:hypothetical protein